VSLGSAVAAIVAPKPIRTSRRDGRLSVFDSCLATPKLLSAKIRIEQADSISASSTRAVLKRQALYKSSDLIECA